MANCKKHNKPKTLTGQYRTKRKIYEYRACDTCYDSKDAVVKALSSAVYETGLRKR
jgi:hypothetical protein